MGGHAFIICINVNNVTSFHVGLGHKGPVLRPRCIGRGRLEPKYYSILQVGEFTLTHSFKSISGNANLKN